MLSIIAGSCLMIASSYIGMGIYNYYKTRTKLYMDYLVFIEFISNEIKYLKSNIFEITDTYLLRYESSFSKIIFDIKEKLDNNEELTIKCNCLSAKEKKEIQNFFKMISHQDRKGLENYFKKEEIAIKAKIEKAKEEENKNGLLAKNLGILIGIGLLIVVI